MDTISIIQGESPIILELYNRASTGLADPLAEAIEPLTGYTTGRMDWRRQNSTVAAELSLTTENGGIAIDQANGKVTITLPADTSGLSDLYYTDVFLFKLDGSSFRFAAFNVQIEESVSK